MLKYLLTVNLLVLALLSASAAWLGDHAHYLRQNQTIYLANPDGKDFTVTIQHDVAYTNPTKPGQPAPVNPNGVYTVTVLAPDASKVLSQVIPISQGAVTLAIPAKGQGTYTVQTQGANYFTITADLARMVVFAGDPTPKEAPVKTWFHLMNLLPRRWWFYVPKGTTEFFLLPSVASGTSGREDMGIVIYTPRGQRTRIFWGDANIVKPGQYTEIRVPVELTMDDQFWSFEVTNGDSHWHTDCQLGFRGIPPYVTSCPEFWFDPQTGQAPECTGVGTDKLPEKSPFAHSMPNTWVGDQSYCGLRGAHRVYLRNDDGRALTAGLGSYVLTTVPAWQVEAKVRTAAGKQLAASTVNEPNWSENVKQFDIPAAPAGQQVVELDGNAYYFYTTPSVPTVLGGAAASPSTFHLEVSGPRHWYFRVPEGTKRFRIATAVEREGGNLVTEVHAPDRCVRLFDSVSAEQNWQTITVPPGLDGKIWFLRIYANSGSALGDPNPQIYRRPTVYGVLTLEGVPPFLAPSWPQWFLPKNEGGG